MRSAASSPPLRGGFIASLVIMTVIAAALFITFKLKNWL